MKMVQYFVYWVMENFKRDKFGNLLLSKTKMNNMICIIDWNKGQNDGYSKLRYV